MNVGSAMTVAVCLAGCGPLMGPMTVRLEPEQQRTVDEMWENMLTPVGRLDRELLLDAVVSSWLYQLGVDRLRMRAEKDLGHGRVVMEIECERVNTEADQFTIMVLDERGRTVRRERYGRGEIEGRMEALGGIWPEKAGGTQTEERRLEREKRRERVVAATQPAVVR